jgi:hydrogenase maturation protease
MLERARTTSPEELARLHGIERSRRTASVVGDALVAAGSRVRIRPRKGADAFDLLLDGKIARVESVERDFDDRTLLAVTIEDDPGRDLGRAGMPGHRFFFHPDELEAVK